MTPAQTGAPDYDARIRRAQHLAAKHAFAAQILAFYQYLAVFQKHLYTQLPQNANRAAVNPTKPSADFRSQLDLAVLLQHFPDLLFLPRRRGPLLVAGPARHFALQGPTAWITFLSDYWGTAGIAPHSHPPEHQQRPASEVLTEFILRVFLQPCAEFLAARRPAPPLEGAHG